MNEQENYLRTSHGAFSGGETVPSVLNRRQRESLADGDKRIVRSDFTEAWPDG